MRSSDVAGSLRNWPVLVIVPPIPPPIVMHCILIRLFFYFILCAGQAQLEKLKTWFPCFFWVSNNRKILQIRMKVCRLVEIVFTWALAGDVSAAQGLTAILLSITELS